MNALGGSKGERNAKPKFAALDINKLYITSRGESLEPSTQKNAAPRKHGMQSLGKVPSARRAPANLPSLKAEVSTPSDQAGSWGIEQSDTQGQNNGTGGNKSTTAGSNNNLSAGAAHSNNNSLYQASPNIASSASTWSTNEFPSLDDTGSCGTNANKMQQQQDQYPSGSQMNTRSQADASWAHQHGNEARSGTGSSVMDSGASGSKGLNNNQHQSSNPDAIAPPLPPQFRALLPPFMRGSDAGSTGSVDGGGPPPPSSSAAPAAQGQVHPVSGPPVAQTHRNNGNSNLAGNFGQPQNYGSQHHSNASSDHQQQRFGSSGLNQSTVPTTATGRMRNAGNGNVGAGGSAASHDRGNGGGGMYNDHQYTGGRRGGGGGAPRHGHRAGGGANASSGGPYSNATRAGGGGGADGGEGNNNSGFPDDHRNLLSYGGIMMDQESIVVRPIIRDEELQRLEAISKDEGWAKDYEFDYNQKIEFSDDESEPNLPSVAAKASNATQSTVSNAKAAAENTGSNHGKPVEYDKPYDKAGTKEREHDRERDRGNGRDREQRGGPQSGMHSNGGYAGRSGGTVSSGSSNVVSGGLDAAEAKERLKQRREEDQKREMERKQAAARKLQELEQKLSRKKTEDSTTSGAGTSGNATTASLAATGLATMKSEDGKAYVNAEQQQLAHERAPLAMKRGKSGERSDTRDTRFDYSNTRNERERDREGSSGSTNTNWDVPAFSKSFQSNLPPRFQRRKQERNAPGPNLPSMNAANNNAGSRSSNIGPVNHGSSAGREGADVKIGIPFSQQYDPRFIHNQQTYGKTTIIARRTDGDAPPPLTWSISRDREEREYEREQQPDRDREGDGGHERDRDRNREHDGNVPLEILKRKLDSEEDTDRLGSIGSDTPNTIKGGGRATPQLARSTSESSQRKISVSSDENHHGQQQYSQQNVPFSAAKTGNLPRESASWDLDGEKDDHCLLSSATEDKSLMLQKEPVSSGGDRHRETPAGFDREPNQRSKKPSSPPLHDAESKRFSIAPFSQPEGVYAGKAAVVSHRKQSSPADTKSATKLWTDGADQATVDGGGHGVKVLTKHSSMDECSNGNLTTLSEEDAMCTATGKITRTDSSEGSSLKTSGATKTMSVAGKEADDKLATMQQHVDGKKFVAPPSQQQRGARDRKQDSRGGGPGMRGSYGSGYQRGDTGPNRGTGGSSWNRSRGGGKIGSRNYNQDYWSESEFSEEGFEDDPSQMGKKTVGGGTKQQHSFQQHQQQHQQQQYRHSGPLQGAGTKTTAQVSNMGTNEGFTPRGEPSRRGRGGSTGGASSLSSMSFRKTPSGAPSAAGSIAKKVDGYGPPSSKSPFGGGDAGMGGSANVSGASDDRIKVKVSIASGGSGCPTAVLMRGCTKLVTIGKSSDEQLAMQGEGKKSFTSVEGEKKLLGERAGDHKKIESHDGEDQTKTESSGAAAPTADAVKQQSFVNVAGQNDKLKATGGGPNGKLGAASIGNHSLLQQHSTVLSIQQAQSQGGTSAPGGGSGCVDTSGYRGASSSAAAAAAAASGAADRNYRGGSGHHAARLVKQQKAGTGDGGRIHGSMGDAGKTSSDANEACETSGTNVTSQIDRDHTAEAVASSTLCTEGSSLIHIISGVQQIPSTLGGAESTQQQQQQQQSMVDKMANMSVSSNVKTDNSKHHLDGSTPPVNTIIFENTNYKSSAVAMAGASTSSSIGSPLNTVGGPGNSSTIKKRNQSSNSSAPSSLGGKSDDSPPFKNAVSAHEGKSHQQLVGSGTTTTQHRSGSSTTTAVGCAQSVLSSSLQQHPKQQQQAAKPVTSTLQGIAFQNADADYGKEMKSFSFETDISHLIDGSKVIKQSTVAAPSTASVGLCVPKSIHTTGATPSVQNMISPSTAELNMKIASVKKVWEMPTVPEQPVGMADESTMPGAGTSGGPGAGGPGGVHISPNFVSGPHQPHLSQFQHAMVGHHNQHSAVPSSYGSFTQEQGTLDHHHFNNSSTKSSTSGSDGGIVLGGTPGANAGDCSDTASGYGTGLQHQQPQQVQPLQQQQQQVVHQQQVVQQVQQQVQQQQQQTVQQAQQVQQQQQQQSHQAHQQQHLQQQPQQSQQSQQPQQGQHHHHAHQQQQQQQSQQQQQAQPQLQQQHQHQQQHQQHHQQQQQQHQQQQHQQQQHQHQHQQHQVQQHQQQQQAQQQLQQQHSGAAQHQTVAGGMAGLNKHPVDVLAAAAVANSANVCKVKPTQQGMHQSGSLGLSPPPQMPSGSIPSAPQPYYPAQYGVSAIPSPPAVLYNSAATMTSQGGLYNAFQLEASGRSQFSQFPTHYGTSGTAGPYNAYMTTPTNIQTAPAPEMYQSLTSQFRMGSVQSPYTNQSSQLNNPSTMLISSSNSSLMSSTVKSNSQQIGAIGSKSGGTVGQPPYGQQYLGMFSPAPLQNSAASYYSNTTGGQNAFFGASAGTTQSYGIPAAVAAANMFGGHGGQNPSMAPQAPPPQPQTPNYGSQFLSSPLLGNNPSMGQQQYRGGPTNSSQNAAAAAAVFLKTNQQTSHIQQQQQQQQQQDTWDLQNQLMQQQQVQNQQQQAGLSAQQQLSSQGSQQTQGGQQPSHNRNLLPPNHVANQMVGGGGNAVVGGGVPGSGASGVVVGGGGNCGNVGRSSSQVQGPGSSGGQRYPSPIQRPTNYTQPPVSGLQQQHQQRSNRQVAGHAQQGAGGGGGGPSPGGPNVGQGMGNSNKHYYGGNRG